MRPFATVLIRILGAWMLVHSLFSWPWAIFGTPLNYLAAGQAVIWFVLGVILWVWAPALSRFVASAEPESLVTIEAKGLVEAGSFLIGLYWFVTTLPYVLAKTITELQDHNDGDALYSMPIPDFISNWGVLILAFVLMVSTRGVGRLFEWTRTAGLGGREEK